MADFGGPAARYALTFGWRVFPLKVGEKTPATRHGFKDGTTDYDQIGAWWSDEPAYNIGMATGEGSGVLVLDVDMKDSDGEASLAALVAEHGALPQTPEQTTGQGAKGVGRQIFFAWPEGVDVRNSAGKLGPGLDVRGNGGYVVLAPSIHPSKRPYAWHPERRPTKVKLAAPPQWLLDLVVKKPAPTPAPVTRPQPVQTHTDGNPYSLRALDEEVQRVASCPPGQQSDTLVRAAFKIGQHVAGGGLQRSMAQSALVDAGLRMTCSDGPWTREQVEDHVRRAMANGEAAPREIPERQERQLRPQQPVTQAKPRQQEREAPQEATVVDLSGRAYPAGDEWKRLLIWKNEEVHDPKRIANAIVLLTYHPELRGLFAWDEFAMRYVVTQRPPWEEEDGADWITRGISDADAVSATAWLERHGMTLQVPQVHSAILVAGKEQVVHPVREHLSQLVWDGKERLTDWLITYLGAADGDYARLVGPAWMIGGVARVMRPGAKMDNMLILEGEQNIGKSKALKALAMMRGRAHFTDEVSDLGSKDAAMQLQGVLIVEIAELNALERSEVNAIKAWLTRTVDRYRPPYGRAIIESPRQCVLAGTMNPDGNGYLQDATGARRFWPVECRFADIAGIERDRDQLWAEAVHRYRASEPWWLNGDAIEIAREEQEKRYQEDPWAELIDEFMVGRESLRISEVMNECLAIPRERRNQAAEKRIGKHLRARGWRRKKARVDGVMAWAFYRPYR